MQWSAANIRILMDLLREGELQPRGILDYLAYTRCPVWQHLMCGHQCCSGIGLIDAYSNSWAFAGGVTLLTSLPSICFPGSLWLARRPKHSWQGPVLPKTMLSPSVTSTTRGSANTRRNATSGTSAWSQAVSNLIRLHSMQQQKIPKGGGSHHPLLRPLPRAPPPLSTSLHGSMNWSTTLIVTLYLTASNLALKLLKPLIWMAILKWTIINQPGSMPHWWKLKSKNKSWKDDILLPLVNQRLWVHLELYPNQMVQFALYMMPLGPPVPWSMITLLPCQNNASNPFKMS